MSFRQKVIGELEEFVSAWLYFALCFLLLVLLKKLILAQYAIGFYGLTAALVGALIVAKVVLVLEYVPLGPIVQRCPVLVDVILRTILYSFGVLIAVVIEHGFEQRHEHGGFRNALAVVIEQRNIDKVWATTIAVGGTILAFNLFSVLRLRFGDGALVRLFFRTPLEELEAKPITPPKAGSGPEKALERL